MKKIALLSVVAAAAMFTACDDDSSTSSSGKLVSCDTKIEMSMLGVDISAHYCFEAAEGSKAGTNVSATCLEATEAVEKTGMGKATSGDGCESGAKKTCDYEGATAYFYNDGDEKLKCEDLIKKLESIEGDEEEAESSESKADEVASSESKADEPASSESKQEEKPEEKPTSSDDKKEEPAAKVLASCLVSMNGTLTKGEYELPLNFKLCVDMTDEENSATLQEKCVPATASTLEPSMPGVEISIENPASCPTEGVTKSCLDRSTGMTIHSYVEADKDTDCSEFLKSSNIEGMLGAESALEKVD